MDIIKQEIAGPVEGVLVRPAAGGRIGVLVLHGSYGPGAEQRCRSLARSGLVALGLRWYGGEGQPPGICEIPIETFTHALDLLHSQGIERLGVLGLSKGAEAALWLSVLDQRIDAVVALSPTSVTWPNLGPGTDGRSRPWRSSWTWRGEPLPFVPLDEAWKPEAHDEDGLVSLRGWYERSRELYPEQYETAAIPVESTAAELVLVAGGDDRTWPCLPAARALRDRRAAVGLPTVLGRVFGRDQAALVRSLIQIIAPRRWRPAR
ncbi:MULTISPECIES: acyl-CoA thioester hydrolase/BAAT C-terminal domain-containing protein [unclassified Streptomyces]|uniref:acyl-CoA thioester hydrolase/BAAT C-terminal domain-containing protein n=1 Tax=unclassified Streptomyces TaxID=2593676 RepID=UPI000DAD0E43|nr:MULTISPECIES: acyl-CoA thioester hydrolase/BAAT C-terminal domain-containing protein [unclassified Streptomyces]PZT73364.1 acyl-CoA thioesterase [Streptomyces sp. AC1-42T]PZT83648.1 acyl-CoA thioesterase [Streptomyces sp. AC1-42W]